MGLLAGAVRVGVSNATAFLATTVRVVPATGSPLGGAPDSAGADGCRRGRGPGGRRRWRGTGDLAGQPRIEVGAGHGMDLEEHDPVARAAQLRALAAERLAGLLVIDLEVELVHHGPGTTSRLNRNCGT